MLALVTKLSSRVRVLNPLGLVITGTLPEKESRDTMFACGFPMSQSRYTCGMIAGRSLPLYDPAAQPATWNERMAAGEFAVHESTSKNAHPVCTVFPSLADAEAYAQQRVAQQPSLGARIFDHQGFVGAPLREYRGEHFKGEREITPKIRRWVGSTFLIVGVVLVLTDWHSDFKLTWPAVVGSRLLIPGLVLLVTEGLILLQKKYEARRGAKHGVELRNL